MTFNSSHFQPKKIAYLCIFTATFQTNLASSQEPPFLKAKRAEDSVLTANGGLKNGVGKAMLNRFNKECPNSYSTGAGANASPDSPEVYCQFLARRTVGALFYDDLNQEARQLYSKMLPNDFKTFSNFNCGFSYSFGSYAIQGAYIEYIFDTTKDPVHAYMCNFLVNPLENYESNGSLRLSEFIESTKNTNSKNQIETLHSSILIPIGKFNSEKNAVHERIKNDFLSDNKAIYCKAANEFDNYSIKEATLLKNAVNHMPKIGLPANLITPIKNRISFLEGIFGASKTGEGC
ncbi:hypothetical protein LJR038_005225 [Acidovorax sp. LjRoot38]|uniref:hypothetical protein n=1 Tax=Acidovorax sp. LjRoot38 TaxID=3342327 RepID=UPI003ECE8897